ncbi:TlpA family protein disulfide reductase [Corynebacterium sp. NPDC060344]|uniref:TlpA family protein disulfide reductase n=1 Tax=Corynebacterium sp. NPDC060344 TaxID=3347101 RepID=UPI003660DE1E
MNDGMNEYRERGPMSGGEGNGNVSRDAGNRDDTVRAGEAGQLGEPVGPVSVPRGSARPSTIIAVLLAVLGTVAVLWFAVSQTMGGGTNADGAAGEEPLADDIVAERPECPEPEPGATGSGPLAGVTLPCLGASQQGEIDVAAALAGKPAVVNVWAWNCAPCREELPVIEEWAAANPDVRVVGVQAATSEGRGSALLEDLGVTTFVSYQDGFDAVGPALELPRVVPITVVLRADGSVAEVLPRAFDSIEDFDAAIRGALA